MKCPACHHVFTPEALVRGGRNRWKGTSKKERSEAMRRVRRGEKKPKS